MDKFDEKMKKALHESVNDLEVSDKIKDEIAERIEKAAVERD